MFNLSNHPHRRYNPLSRRVGAGLAASHAAAVAGPGRETAPASRGRPMTRPATCAPATSAPAASATRTTTRTFVFDNDFAALLPDAPDGTFERGDGLACARERARHLPRSLLLAAPRPDAGRAWTPADLRRWSTRGSSSTASSARMPWIDYVQIFENRGAMMGASNPHPHGQIWATEHLPNEPARAGRASARTSPPHGRTCCAITSRWSCERQRIVVSNDISWRWCPSGRSGRSRRWCSPAARSAPARPAAGERDGLADMLKRLTTRYDNLFEVLVPVLDGLPPAARPTARRTRSGTCTRTSTRRCCARRRCASSWSASSCWRAAARHHPERRPSGCEASGGALPCGRVTR